MYKQGYFKILDNAPLAKNVFRMKLEGDTSYITAPGQFVNIRIEGLFLRRPMSVCDVEGRVLTIIYKVVGRGTERLAAMENGETLDLLTGLGNGFSCEIKATSCLLLGGGAGVAPLYYLAKNLLAEGKKVTAILGFNTAGDVFYKEEFEALGADTIVATADGSAGVKGFVTDALGNISYDYHYACGPLPMLRAVYDRTSGDGEYSFEERMGCGFGACLGCSCKTKNGEKRICKDGPVLKKGEIIW